MIQWTFGLDDDSLDFKDVQNILRGLHYGRQPDEPPQSLLHSEQPHLQESDDHKLKASIIILLPLIGFCKSLHDRQ